MPFFVVLRIIVLFSPLSRAPNLALVRRIFPHLLRPIPAALPDKPLQTLPGLTELAAPPPYNDGFWRDASNSILDLCVTLQLTVQAILPGCANDSLSIPCLPPPFECWSLPLSSSETVPFGHLLCPNDGRKGTSGLVVLRKASDIEQVRERILLPINRPQLLISEKI